MVKSLGDIYRRPQMEVNLISGTSRNLSDMVFTLVQSPLRQDQMGAAKPVQIQIPC